MRWWLLALVLLGCGVSEDLEAYCARTGNCVCDGFDCCVTDGRPCSTEYPCCSEGACNSTGTCGPG